MDAPSGIDFSVSWIIYLSPLLWISLWRSSVLKRTKRHVCFVNYWEFWFHATSILLRAYVTTSVVPGIGDREVLGPRLVRGELPVQRWERRSTLTLHGCLRPAQNLPRREDSPWLFRLHLHISWRMTGQLSGKESAKCVLMTKADSDSVGLET